MRDWQFKSCLYNTYSTDCAKVSPHHSFKREETHLNTLNTFFLNRSALILPRWARPYCFLCAKPRDIAIKTECGPTRFIEIECVASRLGEPCCEDQDRNAWNRTISATSIAERFYFCDKTKWYAFYTRYVAIYRKLVAIKCHGGHQTHFHAKSKLFVNLQRQNAFNSMQFNSNAITYLMAIHTNKNEGKRSCFISFNRDFILQFLDAFYRSTLVLLMKNRQLTQ